MSDLFEREWPLDDAKGAVVLTHGIAEHSGRYEHVARALNEAGYSVFSYDHRGHGQSIGAPGDMGEDVQQVVQDVVDHCVSARASYDRTFLLAHSMGTLFALPAAAQAPEGTLTGLILSGVAVVPGTAVIESMTSGKGVPPETISRDPEVVKAYVDDALIFSDNIPPEMMIRAGEAIQLAVDAIPKVTVPVLLLHGTDDALTSLDGANMVHAQLVITDKTLKVYEGLYHEVLNEPEKDKVIADVVSWLENH
jgi:alpha-beta hydrolase superfamily lysophospholipase